MVDAPAQTGHTGPLIAMGVLLSSYDVECYFFSAAYVTVLGTATSLGQLVCNIPTLDHLHTHDLLIVIVPDLEYWRTHDL